MRRSKHEQILTHVAIFLATFLFLTLVFGVPGAQSAQTFATMNAADKASDIVLSNGNLTATSTCASGCWYGVRATQAKSSGKWYFEVRIDVSYPSYSAHSNVGLAKSSAPLIGSGWGEADSHGWGYSTGGCKTHAGYSCGLTQMSSGDVLGVAADLNAGTLTFYKNGSAISSANFSSVSGSLFPAVSFYYHTFGGTPAAPKVTFNFGASAFAYDPPDGFAEGWYEGEPEDPGASGLWVCATVSADVCTEWISLIDDVSTGAELGVDGAAVSMAVGFGAGLVLLFYAIGTWFGETVRSFRAMFGGRLDG